MSSDFMPVIFKDGPLHNKQQVVEKGRSTIKVAERPKLTLRTTPAKGVEIMPREGRYEWNGTAEIDGHAVFYWKGWQD